MDESDQEILEEPLDYSSDKVLMPLEVQEEACSGQSADESEQDFGDFSSRQDVLGKTMVRSLKRYYLKEFSDHNDFKSYSQKAKTEKFYSTVEQFVKDRLLKTSRFDPARDGVTEEDLTFFVAMMISTAHIKRHVINPKREKTQ